MRIRNGTQKRVSVIHERRAIRPLLSKLRTQAGISQADLAKRLGVGQQTVSRWERGKSRPRYDEMGGIAAAVGGNLAELLAAAGYRAEKAAVATFDAPFPYRLSPSSDGLSVPLDFLGVRFPDAKVHRLGGQGHAQEGADLEATFPDGRGAPSRASASRSSGRRRSMRRSESIRGKRRRSFSFCRRVASPKARSAIAEHEGWDLWDREDVSREIRSLAKEEQRALVDIFFRGQRLALLGKASRARG